jgi:CDP-diacylglycerol--glycerol-3-phosphate 3-phosphatidyltransferase
MRLKMTFSNKLTILRGVSAFLFIPVVMKDDQLIRLFALVFFGIAAISDYYDGRLARLQNEKTDFGVIADPIADKLLTLVGFFSLSFLQPGLVPFWMSWLIAIREVLVTAWRLVALRKGRVIAADAWGKWKTGIQMTAIPYGLLVAAIFSEDRGRAWQEAVRGEWYGILFSGVAILLAWAATILTVVSGILYARAEWRARRR